MAFPRGPPAPPHRAALRRAGGGGSGSAGSGGCGRWMAADVPGIGGVGGAARAQPCVTVMRGQGRRGCVWWGRERGAAREPARRWRVE